LFINKNNVFNQMKPLSPNGKRVNATKDKTQLEEVVIYHEEKGNIFYAKGTIYAWLYDVPNAEEKIQSGEFDFVLFPLGGARFNMSGQTPALLKVWSKPFQKNKKGSEHLIGISQGFFNEEEGILYIEMMTTRKDYRRKGVNSKIVKAMRDYFKLPKDKVVFLDTTKEGKKFEDAKTYNQGGGIEFVPEKKGTLIKGNEIIKYFEKVNGNYRLVFYTLNEAKGKVPKMCDAFGYCQELDSNDVTTEQLAELIKKNNLMENGGSIDKNCIEYIKKTESILKNGYYHCFDSFCLITYNSGNQKDLNVYQTVNLILSKSLSELLKIDEESARNLISNYYDSARRFDTLNIIKELKGCDIIIADRHKIVCYLKYKKGDSINFTYTIGGL